MVDAAPRGRTRPNASHPPPTAGQLTVPCIPAKTAASVCFVISSLQVGIQFTAWSGIREQRQRKLPPLAGTRRQTVPGHAPFAYFRHLTGHLPPPQPLGLRLDLGARKSDRAAGRGAAAEVASARALRAAEPGCRPPDEQGVRNDRHTGRCRRAGRSRPRRPEAGLGANLRVCSAARALTRFHAPPAYRPCPPGRILSASGTAGSTGSRCSTGAIVLTARPTRRSRRSPGG